MHVAALLQEQLRLLRQAGPAQTGGPAQTRAPGPAERRRSRFDEGHAPDALELLNGLRPLELRALAQRLQITAELAAASGVGEVRRALWRALAAATGGGDAEPMVLGGRLVAWTPPRGLSPAAAQWPRALPPPRAAQPPDEEPECLDTLLDAADRALGVRLGPRGRDGKGAWGQRAAELLGVIDRGDEEPDWRGDVEIKTVPVARTRDGLWRVVEDPAISTVGATPIAKLQRVLWLCRAEVPPDDATLLSWYLLEWDPVVATLVERYLHTRPKGPRGGRGRGYYLHKRFFAEAGLWASLNGPPVVETR
ncbi:MAG: hypothetical protein IPI49_18635 [Myxococcales bacterium]|nr:hypothetical protein [Myxococcales bacterium]